jgi:hypothetical protein
MNSEHVLLRKGQLRGRLAAGGSQRRARGGSSPHSYHVPPSLTPYFNPLRLFNLSTLVGPSILLFT